jgi:CHAT domain-containing protein
MPSAAVAMSLIRRAGANARAPMLAMGNPRFPHVGSSSQPGEPPAASAFRDAGGLAPLPAASQEVRALGRTRGATVLEGTAASEAWLKQAALTDYRILHFATHAVVDDWSSARTALALAPGRNEDGFVTLDEIGALRLAADLVVLSACRTAAGVLSHGDGVRGLSTAFLEVGAGAVIATRWSVTDRDAMLFIGAFYAQLADGISIGDALAATKRAAIRRAANPRTWAAFTLVGDGSRRIPPGVRR